ncbi:MAG: methyltransferase domain-containing protein [Acidobacteriota bacterium]
MARYTEEFYEEIYPSGELRRFSVNWWSVRFYALLVQRSLKKIGIEGRQPRVFDAGCGLPFILARLEKGCETWGMDISEYAIERGRLIAPRSKLFKGDIEEGIPESISRNYFDLVISKYIFEHLKEPEEAIRRCCDLLAHGGRIIISVPNMESPMRYLKKEDWFAVKDKTHVSLLAPAEWLAIVRRSGMKVERSFSDGFWDVPYVKFLPCWLQYPIFSLPCAVEVLLAYPILPPKWGENIIIIASKVH